MRRGPLWFTGSADAIYQNLNLIGDERPDIVCVFGADHIYRMDPRQMVERHIESGAGVTVAGIPLAREEASSSASSRRTRTRGSWPSSRSRRTPGHARRSDPEPGLHGQLRLHTDVLLDAVPATGERRQATDMGGDLLPRAGVATRIYDFQQRVPGQAESERGYWRDVGSLDALQPRTWT